MNLLIYMALAFIAGGIIGILVGGSIAAGARADTDFLEKAYRDYINRKDKDV